MGNFLRLTAAILLVGAPACSESPSGSDQGSGADGAQAASSTMTSSTTTTTTTTGNTVSSVGGSGTTSTSTSTNTSGGGAASTTTADSGGAATTGNETTTTAGGGTTSAGGASGMGGSTTTGDGGAGGTGGGVNTDPDARKLLLRDEALSSLLYVDLADANNNWTATVPTGRDLQVVGDRHVMLGTDNGYEERSIDDGSFVSEVNTYAGTQTAHRLHNGNTLLAGVDFSGGQGIVLVEVDSGGAEVDRMQFTGYSYVRLVRETAGGNFLVTADTTVFEGDRDGNVVWSATVQDSAEPHAWKALRIDTGQTVVSTGYAASLQLFDADGNWEQTITGGNGNVNPYFYADMQVLTTGNFVVANWQGHETNLGTSGIQILEYNRAGDLVWYWQQDPAFVSSLQHLIVLDGLDLTKLYVENVTTGVLEAVD